MGILSRIVLRVDRTVAVPTRYQTPSSEPPPYSPLRGRLTYRREHSIPTVLYSQDQLYTHTAVMAANYWASTQYQSWLFTRAQLTTLTATLADQQSFRSDLMRPNLDWQLVNIWISSRKISGKSKGSVTAAEPIKELDSLGPKCLQRPRSSS